MQNYLEFRSEYIATLTELLSCKEDNYPGLITGPRQAALSSKLADMEEAQPDWVMRIEDFLAENHLLQ
tara:strand:- start:141 stop:344 length:204 start_codon:yes stop_codon:yes gene_type:complete